MVCRVSSESFCSTGRHILSKVEGEQSDALIEQVFREIGSLDWTHLHIWEPDANVPGRSDFEPGPTPLVDEIATRFRQHLINSNDPRANDVNVSAGDGARVVNIIIEQPGRWWIGTHRVTEVYEGWPGGVPSLQLPTRWLAELI